MRLPADDMRKLAAIALVLALIFIVAQPRPTQAAITFTYETTLQSTSDLTTYTFSAADIGTANADRCVIVSAVARKAGTAFTLSSASINGVSANIFAQVTNTVTNSDTAAMFSAIVPSDATGDIVVTWSTGVLRTQIGIWTAVGTDNCTTPSDTDTDTSADPTDSITIPTGGVAVGAGLTAAGTTATWTGLTENFDATLETFVTATGASHASPSAGALAITIDFAGTPVESAGVFATWAPAAGGGGGGATSTPIVFIKGRIFIH